MTSSISNIAVPKAPIGAGNAELVAVINRGCFCGTSNPEAGASSLWNVCPTCGTSARHDDLGVVSAQYNNKFKQIAHDAILKFKQLTGKHPSRGGSSWL